MAKSRKPRTRRGRKKPAPSFEGIALKLLRNSIDMTRPRLARLSGVGQSIIGRYERSETSIVTADLRKMLETMDYPYVAWTAMVNLVDYLTSLRRKHRGTRSEITDTELASERSSYLLEPEGGLDWEGARQELRRLAEQAGRRAEQERRELWELLALMLERLQTRAH